jgi:hypothetical protein
MILTAGICLYFDVATEVEDRLAALDGAGGR